MHVYRYVCMYVCVYIYIYVCICIGMYMYVYMCICVYVCIYIYIYTSLYNMYKFSNLLIRWEHGQLLQMFHMPPQMPIETQHKNSFQKNSKDPAKTSSTLHKPPTLEERRRRRHDESSAGPGV